MGSLSHHTRTRVFPSCWGKISPIAPVECGSSVPWSYHRRGITQHYWRSTSSLQYLPAIEPHPMKRLYTLSLYCLLGLGASAQISVRSRDRVYLVKQAPTKPAQPLADAAASPETKP